MLNKIKIIGKLILSPKQKEEKEVGTNLEKDFYSDVEYYNLMIKVPNGSVTLIRCLIKPADNIQQWQQNLEENDIVKVKGFLRNESNGRQIIVRVTKWEKLNEDFENLDINNCNCVRLIGRVNELKNINNDFSFTNHSEKSGFGSNVMSFKILCCSSSSSQLNNSYDNNVFFCRINEKQKIPKLNIQKGDIIMVDGFLQTKKVFDEDKKKLEGRISTVICQRIKLLDNVDPSLEFYPLETCVFDIPVRKIDFSKPKPGSYS